MAIQEAHDFRKNIQPPHITAVKIGFTTLEPESNPSLRDGKTEEQAGYAVSYTYVSPGRAGPFRGKDVLNWKPSKGDEIRAPFGLAIVKSVRKIHPKT